MQNSEKSFAAPKTHIYLISETFVTLCKPLKKVLHFSCQIQRHHLISDGVRVPLLKIQPDSLKNVGVRANFVENGTIAQTASTVFTT